MSSKVMINPFELLGLNANTCTLSDVRKAYFELALLCHPDKGGSVNDMLLLQSAYTWIKEQLQVVKDNSQLSHDDIENLYEAYKNEFPMSKVPNFISVASDALNYNKADFDDLCVTHDVPEEWRSALYEAILLRLYSRMKVGDDGTLQIPEDLTQNLWLIVKEEIEEHLPRFMALSNANGLDENEGASSIQHGYGSMMDKLPMRDVSAPITTSFGKREVILYKEPTHASGDALISNAIKAPKKLDDYSVFTNNASMYDYRKAFEEQDNDNEDSHPHPHELPQAMSPEELTSRLEHLTAERNAFNSYLKK